jgi:hypothetical protein
MRTSQDISEGIRALKTQWVVVGVALAAALLLAAAVALLGFAAPLANASEAVFYISGLLNLGAIIWAFALQHWTRLATLRTHDPEERIAIQYSLSRRSLLPLVAAGLFAIGAALATGQWVHVLFLIPPAGFLILFFPTVHRVKSWLPSGPSETRL